MMDLEEIKNSAQKEWENIDSLESLEQWRIKFLSRKSELSQFFNNLKNTPLKERKEKGKKANEIRAFLNEIYQQKKNKLLDNSYSQKEIDITRPGVKIEIGHLHPLTLITRDLVKTFEKLGFEIVLGEEIETEYYNFDALRIPENHPARDMWDTFWIKSKGKNPVYTDEQKSKLLLRTHTSPMQIHYMETHKPPFRIIVPGRCFRFEATDPHHDFQFHQIEGLVVDNNINLANFKQLINEVLNEIFEQNIIVRFRPSYFPFVTPGLEVDIKLNNEWLEIMGAGMVHPDLFKKVGYSQNKYQGFAFGLGIERIAMVKYNINDIRLFFNSDLRFLKQFS
ncbi:MAG: phenylalanine--tRNA ligase subunit alpha [Minisyncoccia bacterium]|jgi:phenylalanyl-tRNA synthetase alpha chain